jgi:hypothetical protein
MNLQDAIQERGMVLSEHLSALLSGKPLVQQRQHLGHVELDVFQVEIFLVVLLHLQQIVQFEIQLQQSSGTTYNN